MLSDQDREEYFSNTYGPDLGHCILHSVVSLFTHNLFKGSSGKAFSAEFFA